MPVPFSARFWERLKARRPQRAFFRLHCLVRGKGSMTKNTEPDHDRPASAQRPRGFTATEVFEMVAQILASLGARVSDEDRRGAMEILGGLIEQSDPAALPKEGERSGA